MKPSSASQAAEGSPAAGRHRVLTWLHAGSSTPTPSKAPVDLYVAQVHVEGHHQLAALQPTHTDQAEPQPPATPRLRIVQLWRTWTSKTLLPRKADSSGTSSSSSKTLSPAVLKRHTQLCEQQQQQQQQQADDFSSSGNLPAASLSPLRATASPTVVPPAVVEDPLAAGKQQADGVSQALQSSFYRPSHSSTPQTSRPAAPAATAESSPGQSSESAAAATDQSTPKTGLDAAAMVSPTVTYTLRQQQQRPTLQHSPQMFAGASNSPLQQLLQTPAQQQPLQQLQHASGGLQLPEGTALTAYPAVTAAFQGMTGGWLGGSWGAPPAAAHTAAAAQQGLVPQGVPAGGAGHTCSSAAITPGPTATAVTGSGQAMPLSPAAAAAASGSPRLSQDTVSPADVQDWLLRAALLEDELQGRALEVAEELQGVQEHRAHGPPDWPCLDPITSRLQARAAALGSALATLQGAQAVLGGSKAAGRMAPCSRLAVLQLLLADVVARLPGEQLQGLPVLQGLPSLDAAGREICDLAGSSSSIYASVQPLLQTRAAGLALDLCRDASAAQQAQQDTASAADNGPANPAAAAASAHCPASALEASAAAAAGVSTAAPVPQAATPHMHISGLMGYGPQSVGRSEAAPTTWSAVTKPNTCSFPAPSRGGSSSSRANALLQQQQPQHLQHLQPCHQHQQQQQEGPWYADLSPEQDGDAAAADGVLDSLSTVLSNRTFTPRRSLTYESRKAAAAAAGPAASHHSVSMSGWSLQSTQVPKAASGSAAAATAAALTLTGIASSGSWAITAPTDCAAAAEGGPGAGGQHDGLSDMVSVHSPRANSSQQRQKPLQGLGPPAAIAGSSSSSSNRVATASTPSSSSRPGFGFGSGTARADAVAPVGARSMVSEYLQPVAAAVPGAAQYGGPQAASVIQSSAGLLLPAAAFTGPTPAALATVHEAPQAFSDCSAAASYRGRYESCITAASRPASFELQLPAASRLQAAYASTPPAAAAPAAGSSLLQWGQPAATSQVQNAAAVAAAKPVLTSGAQSEVSVSTAAGPAAAAPASSNTLADMRLSAALPAGTDLMRMTVGELLHALTAAVTMTQQKAQQ